MFKVEVGQTYYCIKSYTQAIPIWTQANGHGQSSRVLFQQGKRYQCISLSGEPIMETEITGFYIRPQSELVNIDYTGYLINHFQRRINLIEEILIEGDDE